jgi:signal transduction histidine kinase
VAFLVEIGVEQLRRVELGAVTTIGRDASCSLRVDDPLVAKEHARIRGAEGGRYEVVDLGSRAGTIVGGRRVATRLLSDGDEILVGPARFRFEDVPQAIDARVALRRVSDHDLRRDNEHLRAAMDLIWALQDAADVPALLETVLRAALRLVEAERGAILLMSDSDDRPSLQIARDRDGARVEMLLSSSLMSEVVSTRTAVVTANALTDPRLDGAASLVAQKVRSAMCVPLFHRDEQIGILHLDSRIGGAFADADLALITAVAHQASAAIRNALLSRKVADISNRERQRLHRILAGLPDSILLVDAGGAITFMNARAPALLASANATVLEGTLQRVGPHTLTELTASHEPVEITTTTGPRRVLLASAHELVGGSCGELVVILRDVTEQREREARAAQQERLAAVGQLVAGVAHDFNNLLAVIGNFTQFVLDALVEPQHREDLAQVLDATKRATELIRHLLAFGRREALKPQVIRLDAIVSGVERLLRRAVGEHVELRIETAPELCRVKVDSGMLGHAILNLAVNARDAMPEGGTLTIALSNRRLVAGEPDADGVVPGEYGALEVRDTGTGMAEDVAARVFAPFFTTKAPGKGTGLGLASAAAIVHQVGGALRMRTRLGEGTAFTILLPATEQIDDAVEPSRDALRTGSETVLVAEDERPVREFTRRILEESGYRVLDAGSGPEALDVAARHEGAIDLLVTDLVMPRMTGKQLAKELGAKRAGLRTVYMSGYFDDSSGAGGEAFLAKPFDRVELLQTVRAALDVR